MEHKNFFSARRKPPAIFDQKDFPVILEHSVPQVEILLFSNEKGIMYLFINLYTFSNDK